MSEAKSYRYSVVDVFTADALEGNSLAVFPDASDLDAVTMQKIARELNLTETAFVLPTTREDCVARVRIFSPAKELPFAGHPTVGTAFVLLQKEILLRGSNEFMLEEQVGPVSLRIELGQRPLIWLRMPPIREGRNFDSAQCAKALGLEPQELLPVRPKLLNAGNPTLLVAVKNKVAVDRAWMDASGLQALKDAGDEPFCVYLFTPTDNGAYSRMFAPEYGIPEDPATGSSIGPLAIFMMRHNLISNAAGTRFISEQGTKMGRRSLLHVEICGTEGADGIYVGGHVTPIVEAVMTLGSKQDTDGATKST
jgi:trans-2,3-dihydro-3-hydroxyanthranilate isomerase